MAQFELTEDEHSELIEMYDQAGRTPVLLVGGVNTAQVGWDRVARFMDSLGVKYGYDPGTAEIDRKGRKFDAVPVHAPEGG